MLLRGRVITLLSSLRSFQPNESILPAIQSYRFVHSIQKDVTEPAIQHNQSRSLAQPAFVEDEDDSIEGLHDLKSTEITPETR